MEKIFNNTDEGLIVNIGKELLKNPEMNKNVQEVLKNPEALNEFKNFFKGGSKWRNKHKRNRKKRGSGGTHSKAMSSMYTPTPFHKHMGKSLETFPFASSLTTTEQGEEMRPMSKDDGTRKRSGATAHEIGDEDFRSLSRVDYLRKEAEYFKKEIEDKEKKELSTATKENPTGKKVMYGGKWSLKYKRSINCRKPKGFSQKQYCKRKKRKSRKKRKKSRKKRKRKRKRTRRKRR